jgi:hygromycin-B 4-O-kinase
MLERPTVELATACAFLVERFGDRVVDVVEAPRQGAWSVAYFFSLGDGHFVLRFAPWSDNFETDRRIAEHSSADLPIPHVVEIGEACGYHYAVSERAFGSILEELDVATMRRAFPSVLRMLDALRAADVSSSAGFGPLTPGGDGRCASWREHLLGLADDPPGVTHGWRANLATRPDAERAFDEAYGRFAAVAHAMPELRHLVHSDLLYGNALVADDRVSAVFDWGCAMYGDFLYDAAWLSFFAPWFPGLDAVDVRASVRAHHDDLGLVVDDFDARMRCYEAHVGLASQSYQALIGDWDELARTARRTEAVLGDRSARPRHV